MTHPSILRDTAARPANETYTRGAPFCVNNASSASTAGSRRKSLLSSGSQAPVTILSCRTSLKRQSTHVSGVKGLQVQHEIETRPTVFERGWQPAFVEIEARKGWKQGRGSQKPTQRLRLAHAQSSVLMHGER